MHHILTHAIFCNYGGILQAYALQAVVRKLGTSCSIIDYLPLDWEKWSSTQGIRAKLSYWRTLFYMLAGSRKKHFPRFLLPLRHIVFKKFFMHLTRPKKRPNWGDCFAGASSFIVGSDQVWRAVYARYLEDTPFFFLSKATEQQRQRSFAYAASFGSDEWEGTPEETVECTRLLKDFKAVSVREHSGIRICREVFGVEAVQMPDPTLLLEQSDYTRIIRRWWTRRLPHPSMAVYLLDETEEKNQLTQAVAEQAGLYPQQLTAHGDAPRAMDRFPLSIPQWLRCIREAECVLTDSFHGCVFAIIYNKPFVCLGNEGRGNARFDTLLETFDLEDRLITNATTEKVLQVLNTPINWKRVNAIHDSERERGINFLKENLCE